MPSSPGICQSSSARSGLLPLDHRDRLPARRCLPDHGTSSKDRSCVTEISRRPFIVRHDDAEAGAHIGRLFGWLIA